MLLSVLLYAYCTGVRSSRQIERRLKLEGRRRLPGPGRQRHTRSCDHRPLPGPPRTSPGRAAGPVVEAVRRGRHGPAGAGRLGRYEGRGQRRGRSQPRPQPTAPTPTLRRRSPSCSLRPPRRIGPRTASMAGPAAMSCRGPWPAGPSGWPGCNRPRPSWRPRPSPVSSATSSGWPSRPPPPGPAGSGPGPISGRGGVMRPPTPRRRSTPPTLTAALCAATAGRCSWAQVRRSMATSGGPPQLGDKAVHCDAAPRRAGTGHARDGLLQLGGLRTWALLPRGCTRPAASGTRAAPPARGRASSARPTGGSGSTSSSTLAWRR
jgi:hypothetical protein